MSAGWNSRNRRMAKQRTKNNWYKGKTEVEPPTPSEQGIQATGFSIHQEKEEHPILQQEQVQPEGAVPVMEVSDEGSRDQVQPVVEVSDEGSQDEVSQVEERSFQREDYIRSKDQRLGRRNRE